MLFNNIKSAPKFINPAFPFIVMNFQNLNKIESWQTYLDIAFKSASDGAEAMRTNKGEMLGHDRLNKSKNIELRKIHIIRDILSKALSKIVQSFPQIGELPVFYQELMKITLEVGLLKQSLGGINWAEKRIYALTAEYEKKIVKCMEMTKVNGYRQEFYGRISSTIKQVKNCLEYVDECRKIMKGYPAIKTAEDIKTVALFGFPNVGKSTILSKLTPAKPEIKAYAFTTKQINLGYRKSESHPGEKLQIIDTPGSLDRFEKMNLIEKQAYLALKYCTEKIIYVFDLTEASAPIQDQEELFQRMKKEHKDKPVVVYLSKTDQLDNERIAVFKKAHQKETVFSSLLELEAWIEQ